MKQIIVVICITIFVFFAGFTNVGFADKKLNEAKLENKRVARLEERAKKMAHDIVYVKDLRTGICFAYLYFDIQFSGGVALATVPCDKIPYLLLLERE